MAEELRRRRQQEPTVTEDISGSQDKANAPALQQSGNANTNININTDPIDLMEYLYRLIAHWKLIVIFAVIFGIFGYFYGYHEITPLYRATSTIYVVSMDNPLTSFSSVQLGSYMMKDYIKVFDIWEVHEKVRQELGMENYSYGALRGMISVRNDEGTRMLDITAVSANPQMAADVANAYARVVSDYIADTMRMDKPSIMSVALVPTNPFNISYTRNTTRFLLIGIGAACVFIFIQMLLDDKIKTAEDVTRYTGLTNLAVVPIEEDLRGGSILPRLGKKGKSKE
jgi:capsular polysaccharide biosynthesis protein